MYEATDPYVCPRCGAAARGASACAECGCDLDAFDDLPTASEYAAGGRAAVMEQYAGEIAAHAGAPGRVFPRWGASVIDSIVGLILTLVCGLLGAAAGSAEIGLGLGYLAWVIFYAPAMLAFSRGQTLGKRALKLEVRRRDGGHPGFGRAFLRESVVKLVFSLLVVPLIVDAIVAAASPDKRSLHDRIVGTLVVTTS